MRESGGNGAVPRAGEWLGAFMAGLGFGLGLVEGSAGMLGSGVEVGTAWGYT